MRDVTDLDGLKTYFAEGNKYPGWVEMGWSKPTGAALDKVVERMRMHGRSVQVVGLNEASADLVDRHGATDRTGVEIGLAPHP